MAKDQFLRGGASSKTRRTLQSGRDRRRAPGLVRRFLPAALGACSEGLRIDPDDDDELHFRKAVLHRKAGQPAEAEACWRRILTLKRPDQFCSVDQGIYGHLTLRNLRRPGRRAGRPGRGPAALENGPRRLPGRPRGYGERGSIAVRVRNLLIVAFARNGTVIPHGEFLIEPDFHRLGVFIGVALLKRIVAGENMDGCFQALFCARPCHGLAGHLS